MKEFTEYEKGFLDCYSEFERTITASFEHIKRNPTHEALVQALNMIIVKMHDIHSGFNERSN